MVTASVEDLRARLEAARRRERDARAAGARLVREMRAADRRRETQMLCTLGRAWVRLGEQDADFRRYAQDFLRGYIARDTDHEALRGSAWEVQR